MVGGVNAAATSAVLPLGVLWLLTREPGPRRRSMMLWWPIFTVLGTLWWLVPLFLLGAYSPPFLDFIETAAVTTYPTTLADALRGTSNWVAYLDPDARAGRDLITSVYLPLNSAVVLAAGVAGLAPAAQPAPPVPGLGRARGPRARDDGPSRRRAGVVRLAAGHAARRVARPAAQRAQVRRRAPAAARRRPCLRSRRAPVPLERRPTNPTGPRRVRTDQPDVRDRRRRGGRGRLDVPRVGRAHHSRAGVRRRPRLLAGSGGVARARPGGAPGRGAPRARFVVRHLRVGHASRRADAGTRGQPVGRSQRRAAHPGRQHPHARRDRAAPQRGAGERWARRATSAAPGSPTWSSATTSSAAATLPTRSWSTRRWTTPPGWSGRWASGRTSAESARIEGGRLGKALVNSGWQTEYQAVEVYRLTGDVPYATEAADPETVVVGGPEDLLDLADAGVVGSAPVQLAVDADQSVAPDRVVLTDGLRAVERNFGRLHDSVSPTLSSEEWRDLSRSGVPDYSLEDGARWLTVADLEGADVGDRLEHAGGPRLSRLHAEGRPARGRLDGDPRTAWRSAAFASDAPWWRLDLGSPRELGAVTVRVGNAGDELLVVSTPDWESEPLRFAPGESRSVEVPDTTSSVTVSDVSERSGNVLELAEVDVGIDVVRRLVLPVTPDAWGTPDAIVLRRLDDRRSGCVRLEDVVRCAAHKAGSPEEARDVRRRFVSPASDEAPVRLLVSPDPGPELDKHHSRRISRCRSPPRPQAWTIRERGRWPRWTATPARRGRRRSAALNPELRLSWLGQRTVTGLGMSVNRVVAARLPQRVELSWPGGTRTVVLRRGSARFDPIRTDQLTIRVLDAEPAADLGFDGILAQRADRGQRARPPRRPLPAAEPARRAGPHPVRHGPDHSQQRGVPPHAGRGQPGGHAEPVGGSRRSCAGARRFR